MEVQVQPNSDERNIFQKEALTQETADAEAISY